jgi:hypothetical protein
MAGIKDYSTTAASNSAVGGVSIVEGMLPSSLNNALRAILADTREWYNDSQWVIYGDGDSAFTFAYVSATTFTVAGSDVTSFYHAGRRVRATGSTTGTIFGTISSSSFSSNTSVVVTWDSGSLQNEAIEVSVAALSATNNSIPEGVVSTAVLANGSVTTAKLAADAVDGTKIADDSIDSEHYVDGSIDTQHIADSQITTAKIGDSQVTSAKIADGTIVNADINASAAIDATKIHDGTVTNTEFKYLDGVTSAIQTQLDAKLVKASNLSDLTNTSTARTNLGVAIGTDVQAYDAELAAIAGLTSAADKGIQFTGSGTAGTYDLTTAGKALLDDADASAQRTTLGLGTIATQNANNVTLTGGSITGLGDPATSSEAATKNYVDNLVAGLRTRAVARVGSTANVIIASELENGDTIDGVTLVTGDRVLLKNQSTAAENGLYIVVASGAASRDPEFDIIEELAGQLILVSEGSANADDLYLCTTDASATLGSSAISYTQVFPSSGGTVTSVAVADSGSSEFTVTGSPITSSGTINLEVNSISNTKITGLGTAATLNVGTSANNIVQLDGSAQLPAVDGSQLTNLNAASPGFAIAMSVAL